MFGLSGKIPLMRAKREATLCILSARCYCAVLHLSIAGSTETMMGPIGFVCLCVGPRGQFC